MSDKNHQITQFKILQTSKNTEADAKGKKTWKH